LIELEKIDLEGRTWKRVREYAEKRIEELHKDLEADRDQKETATTRGKIQELRKLLSVERERPRFKKAALNY